MKRLVYVLLLFCSVSHAQIVRHYGQTVKLNGSFYTIAPVSATPDPDPDPDPPTGAGAHPMAHDNQYYVSHPNIQTNDVIGDFHYLCTDSIFNNRVGSSYSFDIFSSSPYSGDFAINSSTGVITVVDAGGIVASGDYTLVIEVTYGAVTDTATCIIEYRSGDVYYVDDTHGGSDAGTYANPYTDFNDIDAATDYTGGETVLVARGTSMPTNTIQVTNQGDRIVFGAYGQGAKPILTGSTGERMLYLGIANDSQDASYGATDVVVMDWKMTGLSSYTDNFAIRSEKNSYDNELYRIECDNINSGNGSLYFRSHDIAAPKNMKVWDCTVSNTDNTNGERALKIEAGGGCYIENFVGLDLSNTGMLCGGYDKTLDATNRWGHVKYAYMEMITSSWESPFQIRSPGVTIQYACVTGWYIGLKFEVTNDTGSPDYANVSDYLILDSYWAVMFDDIHNNAADDSHVWTGITLERIRAVDPYETGITLFEGWPRSGPGSTNQTFDDIEIIQCLVTNTGENGSFATTGRALYVDASIQGDLDVYGNIFVESAKDDVYSDGSMLTGSEFRSNIYTAKSHTWNVESNNYDTDTGDPFVGSGDYRTADGITAVIDQGYDWGQTTDMLLNTIGTADIGPFEKDSTNFNWTDR